MPSLRYLELRLPPMRFWLVDIAYLGPPRPGRLLLEEALGITREFAARGGFGS